MTEHKQPSQWALDEARAFMKQPVPMRPGFLAEDVLALYIEQHKPRSTESQGGKDMTVTQADRDAAEREADSIFLANSDVLCERDREIIARNLAEAFAKHREDAERPLLERVEALEAENARLREALERIVSYDLRIDGSVIDVARQALGETK